MARAPRCSDCSKDMERGFVPDVTHGGWDRAHWHRGDVVSKRFLGMPAGYKVEVKQLIPIVAYRCPSCGLVRLHANAADAK